MNQSLAMTTTILEHSRESKTEVRTGLYLIPRRWLLLLGDFPEHNNVTNVDFIRTSAGIINELEKVAN